MWGTRAWSQIVMGLVLCLCLGACTNRQEQWLESAIMEKRLARDIADYTAAINANGQDAEAYYGRGTACTYRGEYDRAIDDYTKALEIKPQFAMAYGGRGRAYFEQEKWAEARSDLEKAVELDPKGWAREYAQTGLDRLTQEGH